MPFSGQPHLPQLKIDWSDTEMCGRAEMYRNNMFGGTVFSFYGGLWLSYGIWGVLFHGAVFQSPLMYLHGLQMFVILWGKPLPALPFRTLSHVLQARQCVLLRLRWTNYL